MPTQTYDLGQKRLTKASSLQTYDISHGLQLKPQNTENANNLLQVSMSLKEGGNTSDKGINEEATRLVEEFPLTQEMNLQEPFCANLHEYGGGVIDEYNSPTIGQQVLKDPKDEGNVYQLQNYPDTATHINSKRSIQLGSDLNSNTGVKTDIRVASSVKQH